MFLTEIFKWDTKGPNVFCRANNTGVPGKSDHSWFVEEKDLGNDTTTIEYDFKDLPWCGKYRPLRKWASTEFSWGNWFHETQTPEWQQWMECWMYPDLKAPTIKVDWYYPKVHCWVNGTTVVSTIRPGIDETVWFENAQLLKTGEKCYFPQDAFGQDFVLHNEVGDPMGRCAEDGDDDG
ncbi:hypothetical protein B0J14DRAFT_570220 [Halenospora varia]|nr:hypothetical protein B0J14DRAFT_570220 [Halenospora varia]